MEIRKANENDLEQISELLKELTESMDNTEILNQENIIENLQSLLNNENHHLFVAENHEKIIGFINFCTRRTCLHPSPSALIDELVVSSDFRNQGIGKKLIHAVFEKSKELGCSEIEVSTEKKIPQQENFIEVMVLKRLVYFLKRNYS